MNPEYFKLVIRGPTKNQKSETVLALADYFVFIQDPTTHKKPKNNHKLTMENELTVAKKYLLVDF